MSQSSQSAFWRLFETVEPAGLGSGGRQSALGEVELRVAVRRAVSESNLSDSQGLLVLAHLLLWHDHLDAAHTLAQAIATAEGSFVHAIMHRREPDYSNSKYWWRQTGQHPSFGRLGRRAAEFLHLAGTAALERSLLHDGVWKPGAFVDACESVAGRSADDREVTLLRELQRIEFQVFMEALLEG